MQVKDAVFYMKKLFTDYWCKELKYKCIFQNILGDTPIDNVPFAKMDLVHSYADRATLMGMNKTKYRNRGLIYIQLFVPSNTGMDNAYELAQSTMNIYRRPPHDCQINFHGFRFEESTLRYKDFFKVTVIVGFDYDYHF